MTSQVGRIEVEQQHITDIFKDVFKYAPSKLCGMLGNALIVPIYTSLLSPEEYGLYSISIALLSFLCILFSDWVGLSGLRFFRQHQLMKNMPKYLTTLVSLLGFNLVLMLCLAFIFREQFYSFFNIPFKFFCCILVLILPVAIRALLFQLLRAQIKPIAFTLSTIINQIMTIGLSVFFIKVYDLGALSLLLGMAISITLTDVILLFQSDILKHFKWQKIEWPFVLPIVRYGIPIAATSLSAWIINQSNKFIMNSINGFSDVGIVGVAYGLTLPLLMTIFSMLTVAAVPRIINLYEDNYNVAPVVSRFIGYYILVALPLVMTMAFFSLDYVHIFSANEKFYAAYKIIPFFAFGTFFLALTDYTTLQYHLANKTQIDFVLKLSSGILGIILNVILIPKYSLYGVGIATFSANLFYLLLSLIIVIPGLRISYPSNVLNKVFLSLIPYLVCVFFVVDYLVLPPALKMIFLLVIFYCSYWFLGKIFKYCK